MATGISRASVLGTVVVERVVDIGPRGGDPDGAGRGGPEDEAGDH